MEEEKERNGKDENLIQQGLANVVRPKESICKTNFDTLAKNVEAILINPPWNLSNSKEKKSKGHKGVTIEEFKQINFSKSLMIDGLVFIWVEKEIISDVIKIFEK